jgi:DUF4097 and DUF4098 domain-containing protein YvlB
MSINRIVHVRDHVLAPVPARVWALAAGLSLGVLTVLMAAPASAAPMRVTVKGGSGTVTVTGSAQAKQVTGSGRISVGKGEVEVRPDSLDDEIKLTIPVGTAVEVKTMSGDVRVEGVWGAVAIKTVSGSVTVNGAKRLEVKSVSGTIVAENASGPIEAKTVNGDIQIKGKLDDAKIVSVSGKVVLAGFGQGKVSTSSGSLKVQGTLEKGRSAKLVSHSGNVDATLRAPAGLKYDLKTHSGRIDLKLDGKQTQVDSGSAQGTYGAGGASLDLVTFSGDIRLEL